VALDSSSGQTCCRALRCITVRCSVMHCVAFDSSSSHIQNSQRQYFIATHCNTPQHAAPLLPTKFHEPTTSLQLNAVHCNTLEPTAMSYSVLQCVASKTYELRMYVYLTNHPISEIVSYCNTRRNTLQHTPQRTATHCNISPEPSVI